MGVIAFNPMLRAGYDVKLASGVITAGGTLGILIPPSVMIIVYAAVAGQSVVKLYAAAMFPGFFLSFLYLVYIVGWAMINPKIAPRCRRSRRGYPCRPGLRSFQETYSPQHVRRRLLKALVSPARARAIGIDGEPMTYWALVQNFLISLVPFLLTGGTLALVWWYVVIHQQAGVEEASATGLATARRDGARDGRRAPVELGDAVPASSCWFGDASPALLRARAMLWSATTGAWRRALPVLQAADVVGDAARPPDRPRAGRDPVRHHHRDRVRGGRRRRCVHARIPGAHAGLEAHQGGGVPHREDHRDGVLAVRRLGAVLGGVRDPRRAGAGRAMGARRSTCRPCSS